VKTEDLNVRHLRNVDGVRVTFEPGDATKYDLMVVTGPGGAEPVLVMINPERRAMVLPREWHEDGLDVRYVQEKLNVNEYTARMVTSALGSAAFDEMKA
jgi:hypothetical protein